MSGHLPGVPWFYPREVAAVRTDPARDRLSVLLDALGTCEPDHVPALERAVAEGMAALPEKPMDLRRRWLEYRERKYGVPVAP